MSNEGREADRSEEEILPPHWTMVRVEELACDEPASLTDGPFGSNLKTSHYTDEGPRVIRLQNIGVGIFLNDRAHISQEQFVRLARHEARPGDVVIAMLGDRLPRACVVPTDIGPAIVKADCVRLRVHHRLAISAFVSHGLNSHALRRQARVHVHGVGRPRLGLRWLRQLHFPLPPVPEQRRILDQVESYFSRLDDVAASLERIQHHLKQYRASVLKAAVEGRLVPTEAELARQEGRSYEPASVLLERILEERRRYWEESGARGKYKEPVAPDIKGLPELPEGWCWASVDQLSADVRYGTSAKTSRQQQNGVPVLRMGNIVDGQLDLEDLKYLPDGHDEFPDLLLSAGDLLFNRTNSAELVGKSAVFDGRVEKCSFASYLIRVRFCRTELSPWVAHCINSPLGRSWIRTVVAQQVGQANVNGSKLRRFAVPLPPMSESQRALAEVGRQFSLQDAAARAVQANSTRCRRLRQSILKWAFEGKLVDQDPADEPASELLARIRAEREAQATERPQRAQRKKRVKRAQVTDAKVDAPAPEKPKSAARELRAPKPIQLPLDDWSTDDAMATLRKVATRSGAPRDDLLRAAAEHLGYQRLGHRIRDSLSGHVRAAVRRGILTRDGDLYHLATPTIEDYAQAELVTVICSVMRKGTEYPRDEVVRAVVKHLGFQRVTDKMERAVRNAMRVAIRDGHIERRGQQAICRP